MRRPYLAHLGDVSGLRCFLVDGEWIRNIRDVDFTNGAHHLTRRYVPRHEIWVDREAPGAGELSILVAHQIHELTLMLKGMPYLRALHSANRAERRERQARLERPLPSREDARRQVRRCLLAKQGALAVWLVVGKAVRDFFDPNFTQGGHGLRYRFIPRREVWIDDAAVEREHRFVIAHELSELSLMQAGMNYDRAHERALAIEQDLRGGGRRRRAVL